jgi:hypothetical protein
MSKKDEAKHDDAKAVDRFTEMNAVLDECVKEIEVRAAAYRKNQERIGADKSPATAAALSAAQITAMAREAVSARGGAVSAAAVASVADQVAEDVAK